MTERLIIVGGVAAGMSAAAKARRENKQLDIVVYEKSGHVSYGACGLPYFIKGDVPRIEKIIVRTPEQFAKSNIQVNVCHEVLDVDPEQQTVQVRNLETGQEFTDHWDKLILTTGGMAAKPPIPGLDLPGILTLRTVEDALTIWNWIEQKNPKHAVIVGGGYIGLEMAEALVERGLQVDIIEMLPQVMPNMDADMAAYVVPELERHQVGLHLEHKVEAFAGNGQVREVITNAGRFPADMVIFSIGAKPNNALAAAMGLELGPTGAIVVDDHQRTNMPNVWAAGDVAQAINRINGKPTYVPLGTTANKQGRVAGTNAAGGEAIFKGIVGTAVVKVFDLHAARTGLSEVQAKAEGYEVETTLVTSASQAHFMPEHTPLHVKLVYEKGSQQLLGAQMIGQEGIKRIDTIAAALQAGWTTYDLGELDLAYAPPFSPVWDPVLVAANVANK
ncbi:MAG TPA: CoA-disulfide reductase [Anaerolineae bacterium]|nr:CoA-disulfide reductase [Anaerolineales bacterium]HRV91201.1 CoA-disulfide reductase [Anaerolineae bacterium]